MELSNQIESVVSDLRRAGSPGSIGDAADRGPGVLVDPDVLSDGSRFVPSSNPVAVAVDGKGFFVLEDAGARLYGRLGNFSVDARGALVDSEGRAVIGFAIRADGTEADAAPIAIAARDAASKRFSSFSIDEAGVLHAVLPSGPSAHQRSARAKVPIARLALAMFPAPERLRRAGESTVTATSLSGAAELVAPGNRGAGRLKPRVLAAGAIDIEGDLRALWIFRRRRELETALASAFDSCIRTALGLVR